MFRIAAAVIGLSVSLIVAQPSAAQTDGPLFDRMFPNPTRQNGLEEIVAAGDVLKADPSVTPLLTGKTLSEKREALKSSAAQKALALIRQGIVKPIRLPRSADKPNDPDSFASYAHIRSVGRLLGAQAYVLLADGKVGQALDIVRDTLTIGYAVQTETILGGLVGIAVDAIVLRTFAENPDQWSVRDCERVMALAEEWLKTPDPAISALASEKQMNRVLMDQQLGGLALPDRETALALAGAYFDQAINELRKPAWDRKPPGKIEASSSSAQQIVGTLMDTLTPALTKTMDSFTREQASVQLLGIHAAVRKFRWEYSRLPDTLADLTLGNLATDPFTGKAIHYKKLDDRRYEAWSEGAVDPSSGVRSPIYSVPRASLTGAP